jgi:CheY-specific phosphatase CheX
MKCALSLEPSIDVGGTMEEEWPERLETAAAEVLAELAGPPTEGEPGIEEVRGEMSATVGMSGSAWGALSVCCSAVLARMIACRMLGVSWPSEEQISLALGEIACRIARRIRARYIQPAEECLLSPPAIAATEDGEEGWRDGRENYLGAVGFGGLPVWVRFSVEL